MKTIKALLRLLLLTIIISFALSGCYTQLALVSDDSDETAASSQNVPYQPEIVTVIVPIIIHDPAFPPLNNPTPPAGTISTSNSKTSSPAQNQSLPPIRDSGYHRPDASGASQTTTSASQGRTGSSTTRSR